MNVHPLRNIVFCLVAWGLIYLSFIDDLKGAHIVGGEITYECLGSGQYRFTMKVYRDCNSDGANFDNLAAITIYRVGSFSQEVTTLDVPHQPITRIDPDLDPCFVVPPDVCVEEAIYITDIINLPILGNESYVVTYQRCCRNNTISNIFDPESSGASYTVEITPNAQQLCNDSPVFNDFPPIVICSNNPLVFDHSASDANGDELVYELCSPLLGGGLAGSQQMPGDPEAFNGVMPDPAAPPPYNEVNFITPPYSPANPMGGDPQITIDPVTGIITGTPLIIGQFVVGVCVKEFRNGVLLSTIRRDFQFNVTSCQPTVQADIQEDAIIDAQEFVVNSCGNFEIDFINESVQESNIFEYQWSFGINGGLETYNTRDITVVFPDTGTYMGTLVLNPGSVCSDTATIFVNVYPEVIANFDFEYDTCEVGEVMFYDSSFSGSGTILNWNWDFDDGGTSLDVNPMHQFAFAGVKDVKLQVEDINGCIHDTVKTIPWYPVPDFLTIEPSGFEGCEPLRVLFNNLSFPVDSTYDIVWDFGDGNTGGDVSPTHIYENDGLYGVSVEVTSPVGCFASASFSDWILVKPSPTAAFDYAPKELSNFNSTVNFTDQSLEAFAWDWTFGDFETSRLMDPVFTFPDTGLQVVQLVVEHVSGCLDTAEAILDIVPKVRYFLPNAFSPNLDNVNDLFGGVGFFQYMKEFEMTIWNRWGELIFETNNPFESWNGKKQNQGDYVQNGVYLYLVRYRGPRGRPYELRGYATVVK